MHIMRITDIEFIQILQMGTDDSALQNLEGFQWLYAERIQCPVSAQAPTGITILDHSVRWGPSICWVWDD